MNKVMKKCVDLQEVARYTSPEMKIVLFQPEGVLCSSVQGIEHEDFESGGEFEL